LLFSRARRREPGRTAFSAINQETPAWLDRDVNVLRFSANVVLSGVPAFVEDT